ncbi:PREDICTED: glutamyl aminopeptidase-like [Dinoponera quadriceps]|uniref:Glutamyl aminopeptidase-like n=1 Tax=Dinoponera quadriceps TaxID=609295 RepID=A0A6P3WZ71_DINQU|nr:PREDICTED: glutamyl aminopeptidase-like [Dinoponera quadriceps]
MLTPYMDTFHGESSVLLQLLTPMRNIGLHAYKLQIEDESVKLVAHKDNTVRKPQAYSYCENRQILVFKFDDKIKRGEYTLSMKFNGSLLGITGFVATNRTDHQGQTRQSYVTLFGTNDARRAFPCWDGPVWKSKFNISVVHPRTHRAWSNMPLKDQRMTKLADNKTLTNFKTTPNLPAQSLIIAVVDVEHVDILYNDTLHPTWKIYIWCTHEKKDQVDVMSVAVPRIVNFLTKYMGIAWKNSGIDLIAFPNLPTKFVGGWGLVIVREEDVIDKGNFIGYKIEVQRTVAYAIIQQFIATFSGSTTWFVERLTKGLALYLSYYIIEESHLYDQMTDLYVTQIQQPALHNDIILNVSYITDNSDPIYTSLINNKASVSMHMLQHIIQKEKFNQGIAKILNFEHISQYPYPSRNNNRFREWYTPITYTTQQELNFSNTSPRLWLADEIITINVTNPKHWIIFNIQQTSDYTSASYDWWQLFQREIVVDRYKYNLEHVMYKWTSQTNYPVLTFVEHEDDYSRHISQYPYPSRNNNRFREWYTPITYTTQQELNFSNTSPRLWLADEIITINVTNPKHWIIFNIQQTNFYRVNYNTDYWFYITHHLNENDYRKIHRLNRAQLIDDAYHFMMMQEMHYTVFLELTGYMWKEMDYVPWHSMANVLHYMSPFFDFLESEYFKNAPSIP